MAFTNLQSLVLTMCEKKKKTRYIQTCHSIEMKNQDLTNKKSGSGGTKSGLWSNRLQKEITHQKKGLFVISFFQSTTRNVLNCQTSSYMFLSVCVCVCVVFLSFPSDQAITG